MKLCASIIFGLILAAVCLSQDQAGSFDMLRQALKAGDYGSAVRELRSIEAARPEVFAANDLDYLLGRTLEKLGDSAGAIESFESVRSRNSALKDHALWHLSALARSSGNLYLERLYLNELMSFEVDSLAAQAARTRLAESFLESRDPEEAIRRIESGPSQDPVPANSKSGPNIDRERKRLALLAHSYLLAGNTAEALNRFNALLSSTPNTEQPDDIALAAVRGLDAIDSVPSTAAVLTDDEHFRRASVYHFNRDFENARTHYSAIVDQFDSSPLASQSAFQIGRTFAQEGNFVDAVKWFEREQAGDPAVAKDALLQAASAYARLRKYHESIVRYQSFIQNYPNDESIDRAYLNIVDVLRDEGEETAAIQQAQKIQETFRGKQTEALAIFSEARIYFARSEWQDALAALEKLAGRNDLGGATVPGGTTAAEVACMRAYAFEQLGRFAEAIGAYLSIPDGMNEYYGGLATARLKSLAAQPASKPVVDTKLDELIAASRGSDPIAQRRAALDALRLTSSEETRRSLFTTLAHSYARSPEYNKWVKAAPLDAATREILTKPPQGRPDDRHRTIADELLYLGLFDEAAPEFEASMISDLKTSSQRLPANSAYTLAVLYQKGDRADRASAFFRQLWSSPADIQPEMLAPEYANFIYPVPYKEMLLKYAVPRGVDPRFLLSIIRQESGFRPNVKSGAAARGLMQFISTTAEQTARSLGRDDFHDDELYDPSVSILFGSQYVQQLFTFFPQLPDAVAASYNGGEDNMKRWLSRSRSRVPERYVPEIAFGQSKDYAQRVMSNYRMYEMLYDERLESKTPAFLGRYR
ncbi:MAG: transglycosylase SLT domain-containing protein [Acidobacteriota bacterium]